jgi:hypothetical protein
MEEGGRALRYLKGLVIFPLLEEAIMSKVIMAKLTAYIAKGWEWRMED